MQWRPNSDQSQGRRPALRGVLDGLLERAAPFIEGQPEFARPAYGSVFRSGPEMLPGVGDVVAVEDLQTAAQNNDWGGIGLGLLAALPGIPAIGKGARARRGLSILDDAAPAQTGGLMDGMGRTEAESALARYQAANPADTGARVLSPGDAGYPTNAQWDEASQAYVAPVEPDYPIRAYHGSPHSFDQFSLDKIGTGEGAQAYGHGLYFAESEDVARSYRDVLAGERFQRADGSTWSPDRLRHLNVRVEATRNGTDLDSTIARAREILDNPYPDRPAHVREYLEQDLAELEGIKASGGLQPYPGSMYEVGINAHPDTFLDWDRPLSEQPAIAERLGVDPTINARRAAEIRASVADDMRMSGRSEPDSIDLDRIRLAEEMDALDATGNASSYAPRSQEQLEAMLARGISGIRYLDGSSRSAIPPTIKDGPSGLEVYWGNDPTPVGTYPTRQEAEEVARQLDTRSRNYVVFNDALIKVLRKYGISALGLGVGGTGLMSTESEQPTPTGL